MEVRSDCPSTDTIHGIDIRKLGDVAKTNRRNDVLEDDFESAICE